MMKIRNTVAVAALLAGAAVLSAPTDVMAQGGVHSGLYGTIGGGYNILRDADIDGSGIDTKAEFDGGWVFLGALGWGWGNGLRTELEFSGRRNEVDGATGKATTGDVDSQAIMFNVLYDFALGDFVPYIGGGIGAARIHYDGIAPVGGIVNDHDWQFAYQGIIGVQYFFTPSFAVFADARYTASLDPEFKTSGGAKVDGEWENYSFTAGIRFNFGVPSPAPVVAPPPPPAITRSFLVFFDFDRSNITPEADRVIQQAYDNYRRAGAVRLTLTGHADRSGSDRYNQALSLRRANAVKARMMQLGVPENQIAVIGRGESQPLVPTRDGVREPQNRRVEIVF
jgi:outer membrane protein OmpA-like peptidoglycan-associated protein